MQKLSALRRFVRPVLDYALPPRCPGCGCMVEDDRRFCAECWLKLDFLGDPCCARCGIPFAFDEGEGAECGTCLAHPPEYDSARAVLAYDDLASGIAIRLKYGRRLGLARLMAQHMAARMPASVDTRWLIVPVPLHRWRMWGRGFNQAAVIADHIARASGVPTEKRALVRHRSTRPLRNMSAAMRAKAVRGAFTLDRALGDRVRGRDIILIDDIHTTGATAQACAQELRRGGARSVHLLCWARVVPGHDRSKIDPAIDF